MKEQYITIDEYGDKFYYSDKEMTVHHREDGPAVEYSDGSKAWYINGLLHREDGPAYEDVNCTKRWYINGKKLTEDEFNAATWNEFTLDEIAEKMGVSVDRLKIKK